MFKLEPSITEWRRQMLAAGIKPESLDELEGHLREEIERQVKQGTSGQLAFKMAVQIVGEPAVIHEEFKRADGVKELLLRTTKDHADLGLLIAMAFVVGMTINVAFFDFYPIPIIIVNHVNYPEALAIYNQFAGGGWGNAAFGNVSVWLQSICLAEMVLMCLIVRFSATRQMPSDANDLNRRRHTARFGQLVLSLESLYIIFLPSDLPFRSLTCALITCTIFVFLLRKPAHVSERESAIS